MVVKGGYWDAHELTLHLGHLSGMSCLVSHSAPRPLPLTCGVEIR